MGTCRFWQARACVIERVGGAAAPAVEEVGLGAAAGRVLAEQIRADRDFPPVERSIRDGYAVRSQDLPGEFEVTGEVRAGESMAEEVGRRQAVEIMTGAPVPRGADQIVMVEETRREGDRMVTGRQPQPGDFVNPRGSEAREGDVLLEAGIRLDYSGVAAVATVGKLRVRVYGRPRVAILSTGDEVVEVGERPQEHQVRNSNAYSLAVQVRRAGGQPEILPVAPDEYEATRALVERGLESDLLLISGGVSAGKYDIVERVLADAGAEFYFDRVLIQPGQPLVFGRAHGKFFFGLPGNPASTMVTFELFARAALELLGGQKETGLPMMRARLTKDFRHKPGLTRFLPARLEANGIDLTPIPWQGSSDVPAQARANAYLVADAERESWAAGEWIEALPK